MLKKQEVKKLIEQYGHRSQQSMVAAMLDDIERMICAGVPVTRIVEFLNDQNILKISRSSFVNALYTVRKNKRKMENGQDSGLAKRKQKNVLPESLPPAGSEGKTDKDGEAEFPW